MKKTVQSIRNLFKLRKDNEAIIEGVIKDFRALSEQEDYYSISIRVSNF